jgi:hypothetical protein
MLLYSMCSMPCTCTTLHSQNTGPATPLQAVLQERARCRNLSTPWRACTTCCRCVTRTPWPCAAAAAALPVCTGGSCRAVHCWLTYMPWWTNPALLSRAHVNTHCLWGPVLSRRTPCSVGGTQSRQGLTSSKAVAWWHSLVHLFEAPLLSCSSIVLLIRQLLLLWSATRTTP